MPDCMQRVLKCVLVGLAVLSPYSGCEEPAGPEEVPVGYFRVDSLDVTVYVDEDMIGRITTNADIRYVYHFERSEGYVKCNVLRTIIHDYDVTLCSLYPAQCAVDSMYEYVFGVWGYHDYSYLEETEIRLTIEGMFTDCPYCDGGCDRCRYVWSTEAVVDVENRIGSH